MMKRLLLTLLTLPAPALAEDAIIYADCGNNGCTCHISAIPASEIAAISGVPTPANATQLTLVGRNGTYHWSTASRSEIDTDAGGDGACEIEVFEPIVPKDGTWTGTMDVTGIDGCHPTVAEMVPPIAESMTQTQTITWGGAFDPAKLAKGGKSPVVKWTEVRPDYFTGTVPMEPNGVLDVSVDATATLLAPNHATATLTIRFDPASSADAGALALIGMNGCEANATYDFQQTGG